MGLSPLESDRLFYYVKQTQVLIYGSVNLIVRLKAAGYKVFALTDNVHEIVSHLQTTYSFWSLFDSAIFSAEVGILKPQPEIYQTLLAIYDLNAEESVFIDDMSYNVQGTKSVGIKGIQFENSAQCENELMLLGLKF